MSVIIERKIDQSIGKRGIIIPCFCTVQDDPYAYQIEVTLSKNGQENRHVLIAIGDEEIRRNLPVIKESVKYEWSKTAVDCVRVDGDCVLTKVKLFVDGVSSVSEADIFVAIGEKNSDTDSWDDTKIIDVPTLSQLPYEDRERDLRCSPTNVAMVGQYYQKVCSVPDVCNLVYHSDMKPPVAKETLAYGVWPMAIYAASRLGLKGYIHCFRSMKDVVTCLNQNIPIVTTVSYQEGELSRAAIPSTEGHLITLCGIKGDSVVVNDPVAPLEEVRRTYNAQEFFTVWFRKGAIGYVFEKT
jgi:hypothetical protein